MARVITFATFLLLFSSVNPAFSQAVLEINTQHHCLYHGSTLPSALQKMPKERQVVRWVDQILQAGNAERRFKLLAANVPNVVAVADSGQYYLLYNPAYLTELNDEVLAKALVAHAVGHLVNQHVLDDTHRIWEEQEADIFAGYTLFSLTGLSLDSLKALPQKLHLSHAVSAEQRSQALENGWNRANAYLKVRTDNAFFDNKTNTQKWRMPDFPWPPPCCPNTYTLSTQLNRSFRTLGAVDQQLTKALKSRGYSEHRYLSLPNGFAMVTKMEQFDGSTGVAKNPGRWLDYPVQERFEGLLDYVRSLFVPTKGYFRVFVFAVTDQPTNSPGEPLTKEEAVAWLRNGFNHLPHEMAKQRLTARHFVDAYVYVFQATDSDNRAKPCLSGCLNDCRIHLEKSGILGIWRKN